MIVKKIDDLGRVTIPKDLKKGLGWQSDDLIEIIPKTDNSVLLKRYIPTNSSEAVHLRRAVEDWASAEDLLPDVREAISLLDKVAYLLGQAESKLQN